MMQPICEHCETVIESDVFVVNRYTWCQDCFNKYVLSEIQMSAEDYINSATTRINPDGFDYDTVDGSSITTIKDSVVRTID